MTCLESHWISNWGAMCHSCRVGIEIFILGLQELPINFSSVLSTMKYIDSNIGNKICYSCNFNSFSPELSFSHAADDH